MEITITGVFAYITSYKLKKPVKLDFVGGVRTIIKRDALIIKITTNSEIIGWGSGDTGEMGNRNWNIKDILKVINVDLNKILKGEDPSEIKELWKKCSSLLDIREPLFSQIFGGIDIALWDIKGKIIGKPICEILGRKRQYIDCYASAGMYQSIDNYINEANELYNAGFRAYKMRPGTSPSKDIDIIKTIVEEFNDLKVLVDAHTWWRAAPKIYTNSIIFELVRELDKLGLYWIEDPLHYEDHGSYLKLRQITETLISTGENEQGPEDVKKLINKQLCDVIIVDVRLHGGITKCLEIANLANEFGIYYAAHNFSDMISQAANAHIMLSVEKPSLFEYPTYTNNLWKGMYDNCLVTDLVNEEIRYHNGQISVTDNPGLGVEPIPNFESKYPYIEGSWTIWENDKGELITKQ